MAATFYETEIDIKCEKLWHESEEMGKIIKNN